MSSSLLALGLGALGVFAAPLGPTVTLDFGTFRGISDFLTGTDTFYGLPFAEPPTGQLRLRPPQSFTTNYGTTIQDASVPKSDCPQQAVSLVSSEALVYLRTYAGPNFTAYLSLTGTGSEDCLYMNIIRPSTATPGSKLPVMFWIFGGGFELGGISEYDGSHLVQQSISMRQDVIWVAANYRVSAWGFMPGQEVQDDGAANIGLRDQLFGESAGAISIAFQLLMYGGQTNGTFRAAIMESGSSVPVGPLSYGQSIFDQIVDFTNCSAASDKLECLRGLDENTFMQAVAITPNVESAFVNLHLAYLPRTDYDTIPDLPQNLLRAGRFARLPVISGDNEDEGTIFQFTSLNVTTNDEFACYAKEMFPLLSNSTLSMLLEAYPEDPAIGSPYNTGDLYALTPQNKRIASFLGDTTWNAARRFFSQIYVNASVPIWSYLFSHTNTIPFLGAFHASEIPFVYGDIPDLTSVQMRASWISFANTLDPNNIGEFGIGIDLPYWPQYGTDGVQMEFGPLASWLTYDTYRENSTEVASSNIDEFTI
ncbi:sterol esterase [Dacryopinax primogenitus]|uniref:Sterol esterase n=1 Tax=Dacryopinax primogenitus (strain DJM 731) TaxID=1858805 RepID=M5FZP4_DACPD|nr:sterol esterase [Dacryopinax primogenitus]EJT99036.1 sterol esterase [Dacryopinax primogenitus]